MAKAKETVSIMKAWWGFVVFVWRTFGLYWGWAWARYKGRLPGRRGKQNHRFVIHVRCEEPPPAVGSGELYFQDVTLSGSLSGEEVPRLLAFVAVHERPPSAVVVSGDMICAVNGAMHGTYVALKTDRSPAVRVCEGAVLQITGETPAITAPGGDLRVGEEEIGST